MTRLRCVICKMIFKRHPGLIAIGVALLLFRSGEYKCYVILDASCVMVKSNLASFRTSCTRSCVASGCCRIVFIRCGRIVEAVALRHTQAHCSSQAERSV